MIFTAVINGVLTLLNFFIGLLPSLPQVPQMFTELVNTLLTYITAPLKVIAYFMGNTFFIWVFVAILTVEAFHYIYLGTMWIIHKIPWLNIH